MYMYTHKDAHEAATTRIPHSIEHFSFAEYRLFYGALLQKRPMILRCNKTAYYGVATISKLIKITVLFCRISSLLWGSFTKETYDFKQPTNRSHPIIEAHMTQHNTHTQAPAPRYHTRKERGEIHGDRGGKGGEDPDRI